MVKVSLYDAPFDKFLHIEPMCQWVREVLGDTTVKNMSGENVLESIDHHYYEGNDQWQYHFVRTTLEPAEEDRHLYKVTTDRDGDNVYHEFLEALYFVLPDDTYALQMLLTLI